MPSNAHIAHHLNYPQARLVLELTLQPVFLGCAEQVAGQLTRATKNRPALVEKTWEQGHLRFSLNKTGWELKQFLVGQLTERLKYV